MAVITQLREIGLARTVEHRLDGLLQRGLTAFGGQYLMSAAVTDQPRILGLTAGRVDGDQSTGQFQSAEQLGDHGDLVGAVGDGHLSQRQVVFRSPGADQVQAAGSGVAFAPPRSSSVSTRP